MGREELREAFEAGMESGGLSSDYNMSRERPFEFDEWYHQVYELGVPFTNPSLLHKE